jgi:hypothetical protein
MDAERASLRCAGVASSSASGQLVRNAPFRSTTVEANSCANRRTCRGEPCGMNPVSKPPSIGNAFSREKLIGAD